MLIAIGLFPVVSGYKLSVSSSSLTVQTRLTNDNNNVTKINYMNIFYLDRDPYKAAEKHYNKLIYKIKRLFRNKKYDVYCPYCTSCGETGCCSPTICINHPKGFYCERNMGELRVSHYTLNNFWNWIAENKEKNKEVYDKLNEIYRKEDDELDEYFKTLPEKLTFKEKVANLLKKYKYT